jgi:hypothetical protein
VHQHVHPRLLPIGVYSRAAAPGRACQIKSLRFALAAAGQGASGLHAILLCELTAPSVTGVGPEATARRFSSGRVGRGHSYSYGASSIAWKIVRRYAGLRLPPVLIVFHRLSVSTSFVLAALRALHVDASGAVEVMAGTEEGWGSSRAV